MIRRCSKCGCPKFKTKRTVTQNVVIDGNYIIKKEEKIISKGFTGDFICEQCGKVYQTLENLWNDNSPYAGIIHYFDSDENYECASDEELLSVYKNDLRECGVSAQQVIGIDPLNISLQYEVKKLLMNECSEDMLSFQEFLEKQKLN